ncbi:MAG: TAXI family TRAP transporter solute-binding subunit [Polaromonas sp.]|nr:TAXI family TRAP transporter solute-binding subunit [Polaromonas sp.]
MLIIPSLTRKQTLLLTVLVLAGLAVALSMFSRSVIPAPPAHVQMTTGAPDGAYHQFALRYQAYLQANGVELELLPSSGSVENLARLHGDMPIGLVQGGLGEPVAADEDGESATPLRSLGVVAYEPVWMFAAPALAERLSKGLGGLAGKRVAVGADGSGTRKVALELLKAYGVGAGNATLLPESGVTAAGALLADGLDAVILIGAPQAPAVQMLLGRQDAVHLVSIDHAEGLTRRLPYLSLVTLKAGSVDPAQDRPRVDITLLSTTANLVIREDLHPALAYLLLEAARQVHRGGTLLNRPGEFPNQASSDFPLADEATRYYRDGRPFLQRYLPYWAANALQRLLLVLLPLIAISIPVFRVVPKLFEWKEKNRLYRRYGVLLGMERDIQLRRLDAEDIRAATAQLDQIERDVSRMKFPLDFSDRVYTLRQHVDYVRRQLQAQAAGSAPPAGPGSNSPGT